MSYHGSMRALLVLGLIFSMACESKPTRKASATEKATRTEEFGPDVELQSELESGPPPAEQLILTNPRVLDCLARAVQPSDLHFSLVIQGKLTSTGTLLPPVRMDGGTPEIRACLAQALAGIDFPVAGTGVLKFRIFRGEMGGRKAKSFILRKPIPKNFE